MVKDVIVMVMAPGGLIPVWETLQLELSILNNLPNTSTWMPPTQQHEQNDQETKHACTFNKERKISKRNPQCPVSTYNSLIKSMPIYIA